MLNLDFDMLWASKCEYPSKHVVKPNFHEYYQIVYVLGGEGVINIEETRHITQVGQLYIIKPNLKHAIIASNSKALITVEIKFYCANDFTNNMLLSLPVFIPNTDIDIRNIFICITEEIKKQKMYFKEMINTLLGQIAYLIFRKSNETKEDKIDYPREIIENKVEYQPINNKVLEEAIAYINENYSEPVNLSDLAKRVYLNPIYFCTVFKDAFGVSPMHYLQIVRIENSKKLLKNTNHSITQISNKVGFQSVHHFSKLFKSNVGMSPSDFRNRNQGFIWVDFIGDIADFS